jgi:hypothetical protein
VEVSHECSGLKGFLGWRRSEHETGVHQMSTHFIITESCNTGQVVIVDEGHIAVRRLLRNVFLGRILYSV